MPEFLTVAGQIQSPNDGLSVHLLRSLSATPLRCAMDDMDFDTMFDMPGGDDYREVTDVFREAGRGELVL